MEDGPLRMVIRFVYRYRASEIEQDMIVYADNRRIDFVTKADWHEDHRLLKTLFEVDIRATKASYDIQYGFVERPTHWNTSWDWARFEAVSYTHLRRVCPSGSLFRGSFPHRARGCYPPSVRTLLPAAAVFLPEQKIRYPSFPEGQIFSPPGIPRRFYVPPFL